jgi:hypothetical protein
MEATDRAAGTLRRKEPGPERTREGGGFADRRSTEPSLATVTSANAQRREQD